MVEGRQFHPILGKRACEKLKLIKMIDNNSINQMKATSEPMTKETMLKDYNEKVGELEGTYKIKILKKQKQ